MQKFKIHEKYLSDKKHFKRWADLINCEGIISKCGNNETMHTTSYTRYIYMGLFPDEEII